jgi:hypothetical protein
MPLSSDQATRKNRLNAYASASKSVVRRRWNKWERYAAATGSALALTTGASASIIWSGLQNLTVSVPEVGSNFNHSSHKQVDIDGAGHLFNLNLNNHRFFSTSTETWTRPIGSSSISTFTTTYTSSNRQVVARLSGGSAGARVATSGGIPAKLTNGTAIGSNLSFNSGGALHSISTYNGSTWSNTGAFARNDAGFVGVRFDRSGETHYGWIHFSFQDSNNDGWLDSITATDWAWENVADTSIAAGETSGGSVPEPGSMSLSVLALGSAGVLALRRRRQTSAAVTKQTTES